mmetsp:Transcript_1207/g.4157  ORF Transcript_1207/g.4157 Transcript_1207/m.4157 type:complete len:95 (+) Transcript_1207:32-316(+)|eukprot:CAMPEP_0117443092 /NCGR_PEP_ID=MMETSP0759-20121206/4509_1 /TAXON_ID=63605 /ORGANISM="Percolomonas cosmopolitus, Strain WS" /LENGTH=94 /DNA_ID=CAMNT_0005235041 /DNA_START=16 /DNA_END=300 /DNA_ORIENTATION=-
MSSSNPILESIHKKLDDHLQPSHLTITPNDPNSSCGLMLKLFVVSDKFNGKRLLERQRYVNEILAKELADGTLHAVEYEKTWTPDQYEKNANNK